MRGKVGHAAEGPAQRGAKWWPKPSYGCYRRGASRPSARRHRSRRVRQGMLRWSPFGKTCLSESLQRPGRVHALYVMPFYPPVALLAPTAGPARPWQRGCCHSHQAFHGPCACFLGFSRAPLFSIHALSDPDLATIDLQRSGRPPAPRALALSIARLKSMPRAPRTRPRGVFMAAAAPVIR